MRSLLWALVIMLLAVSALGFLAGRMRMSKRDDKKEFVIVISAADADERYFWLQVEGCSAEITDDGIICGLGWYGRTDRQWAGKQQPVSFRDAPRGVPLRFEARITDRAGKALATSSYLTSRGF